MVSCRVVFTMGRLNGNNIWHVVNWNALTRSQKLSERNSPEAKRDTEEKERICVTGHGAERTTVCVDVYICVCVPCFVVCRAPFSMQVVPCLCRGVDCT